MNDFRELASHEGWRPAGYAVKPPAEEKVNGEFAALVQNKSRLPGKTHS